MLEIEDKIMYATVKMIFLCLKSVFFILFKSSLIYL